MCAGEACLDGNGGMSPDVVGPDVMGVAWAYLLIVPVTMWTTWLPASVVWPEWVPPDLAVTSVRLSESRRMAGMRKPTYSSMESTMRPPLGPLGLGRVRRTLAADGCPWWQTGPVAEPGFAEKLPCSESTRSRRCNPSLTVDLLTRLIFRKYDGVLSWCSNRRRMSGSDMWDETGALTASPLLVEVWHCCWIVWLDHYYGVR